MKRLLATFLILATTIFYSPSPALGYATKSLDLERSSTQGLSISDGATGQDLTGDWTMEFWVKFETSPESAQTYVLDKWVGGGNQRGWLVYWTGAANTFRFRSSDDGTSGGDVSVDVTTSGSISTGVWYHYALVYDISAGEAFVYRATEGTDHTLLGSNTGGNTTIHNSTADNFWFSEGGYANGIDGLVSAFRIWDDIRTTGELDSNKFSLFAGAETNMIAEYSFDDVYTDASGNGSTLTAGNSPVFVEDVPVAPAVAGGTPQPPQLNLGFGII